MTTAQEVNEDENDCHDDVIVVIRVSKLYNYSGTLLIVTYYCYSSTIIPKAASRLFEIYARTLYALVIANAFVRSSEILLLPKKVINTSTVK